MHIEEFRDFCISKPGVTEDFPFDNKTLVFKVMGKMFALTDVDEFQRINLKCDPEWAQELREEHPEISGGYHMNKRLWNTVQMHGSLEDDFIKEMIDHSYQQVVNGLTKKLKNELAQLSP